mmetsp:Transcript_41376/g.67118  ORF Transcript_41376/g.67118 Transcript_41376/m.67118 type:complete len:1034 (+) Transcript_41376:223-3324(+)
MESRSDIPVDLRYIRGLEIFAGELLSQSLASFAPDAIRSQLPFEFSSIEKDQDAYICRGAVRVRAPPQRLYSALRKYRNGAHKNWMIGIEQCETIAAPDKDTEISRLLIRFLLAKVDRLELRTMRRYGSGLVHIRSIPAERVFEGPFKPNDETVIYIEGCDQGRSCRVVMYWHLHHRNIPLTLSEPSMKRLLGRLGCLSVSRLLRLATIEESQFMGSAASSETSSSLLPLPEAVSPSGDADQLRLFLGSFMLQERPSETGVSGHMHNDAAAQAALRALDEVWQSEEAAAKSLYGQAATAERSLEADQAKTQQQQEEPPLSASSNAPPEAGMSSSPKTESDHMISPASAATTSANAPPASPSAALSSSSRLLSSTTPRRGPDSQSEVDGFLSIPSEEASSVVARDAHSSSATAGTAAASLSVPEAPIILLPVMDTLRSWLIPTSVCSTSLWDIRIPFSNSVTSLANVPTFAPPAPMPALVVSAPKSEPASTSTMTLSAVQQVSSMSSEVPVSLAHIHTVSPSASDTASTSFVSMTPPMPSRQHSRESDLVSNSSTSTGIPSATLTRQLSRESEMVPATSSPFNAPALGRQHSRESEMTAANAPTWQQQQVQPPQAMREPPQASAYGAGYERPALVPGGGGGVERPHSIQHERYPSQERYHPYAYQEMPSGQGGHGSGVQRYDQPHPGAAYYGGSPSQQAQDVDWREYERQNSRGAYAMMPSSPPRMPAAAYGPQGTGLSSISTGRPAPTQPTPTASSIARFGGPGGPGPGPSSAHGYEYYAGAGSATKMEVERRDYMGEHGHSRYSMMASPPRGAMPPSTTALHQPHPQSSRPIYRSDREPAEGYVNPPGGPGGFGMSSRSDYPSDREAPYPYSHVPGPPRHYHEPYPSGPPGMPPSRYPSSHSPDPYSYAPVPSEMGDDTYRRSSGSSMHPSHLSRAPPQQVTSPAPTTSSTGEPIKRKRGRPRKLVAIEPHELPPDQNPFQVRFPLPEHLRVRTTLPPAVGPPPQLQQLQLPSPSVSEAKHFMGGPYQTTHP